MVNHESPSKVETLEPSSNKGLHAFYWVFVIALLVGIGILVYLLIDSRSEINSLNLKLVTSSIELE